MKNGITENYNDKNKSENKIKLIVHILLLFNCIKSGVTFETPCIILKIFNVTKSDWA